MDDEADLGVNWVLERWDFGGGREVNREEADWGFGREEKREEAKGGFWGWRDSEGLLCCDGGGGGGG